MKTLGTPQTLKEAIQNGLEDVKPGRERVDIVWIHVKDYLAQKFGLNFTEEARVLWNLLFPENLR